jgi:hypothetical protein
VGVKSKLVEEQIEAFVANLREARETFAKECRVAEETETIKYVAKNELLRNPEFRAEAQAAAEKILEIIKGWDV